MIKINILVIGNGFDLAYKQPTKYIDFINFLVYFYNKEIKDIINGFGFRDYKTRKIEIEIEPFYNRLHEKIKKKINDESEFDRDKWKVYYEKIEHNLWARYFIDKIDDMPNNSGWIDCEKEISDIIRAIEWKIQELRRGSNFDYKEDSFEYENNQLVNKFLKYLPRSGRYSGYHKRTVFPDFEDKLKGDLDDFIEFLEVYLREFVNKEGIENSVCEIDDIVNGIGKFKGKEVDHILNFNYTNTFSYVYPDCKANKYCDHIHGEIRDNDEDRRNNMVLGIDEYLGEEEKNNNLNFIYYKKYFQRLYKMNSFDYKDWICEIKEERLKKKKELSEIKKEINQYRFRDKDTLLKIEDLNKKKERISTQLSKENYSNIYFFGHSLDVTDKDILRRLILGYGEGEDKSSDKDYKVNIKIFYFDETAYKDQLAHLVRVIGQDELIDRCTGPDRNIEFIKQEKTE